MYLCGRRFNSLTFTRENKRCIIAAMFFSGDAGVNDVLPSLDCSSRPTSHEILLYRLFGTVWWVIVLPVLLFPSTKTASNTHCWLFVIYLSTREANHFTSTEGSTRSLVWNQSQQQSPLLEHVTSIESGSRSGSFTLQSLDLPRKGAYQTTPVQASACKIAKAVSHEGRHWWKDNPQGIEDNKEKTESGTYSGEAW